MDPAVAAILQPSITRFAVAAAGITGPGDVRERLRLAEAGELGECDAKALAADFDTLAVLLTRR
jgi:hypothetical protein